MKYILLVCSLFLFLTCREKNKPTVQDSDDYYTCSMHPQIRRPAPGNCPICGMNLIHVKKGGEMASDADLVLNDQQVQLGGIQTDTMGKHSIGDQMILNATLNIDESQTVTLNTPVPGRIEKLYVKSVGDFVHRGERLYDLYSEPLNSAKQEFLLALEKQKVLGNSIIDFKQLIESSRNKLLLWGMQVEQINELARTKSSSPITSFYSPSEGYVSSLESHEGDFLTEGVTILRLAKLNLMWAEAQVYATQLSHIDREGSAVVQVPALSLDIPGRIEFANPEMNPSARIDLIRIEINNPQGLLKPGMPAYVILKNRPSRALTLPVDAVIRNEKGNLVWIMTGRNRFKPLEVKTGVDDGLQVEIMEGLKAGDVVVISGAYLLNSEYIIRHGSAPIMAQAEK